MDLNPKYIDL
jgi:uncharacterized protein YkwD